MLTLKFSCDSETKEMDRDYLCVQAAVVHGECPCVQLQCMEVPYVCRLQCLEIPHVYKLWSMEVPHVCILQCMEIPHVYRLLQYTENPPNVCTLLW